MNDLDYLARDVHSAQEAVDGAHRTLGETGSRAYPDSGDYREAMQAGRRAVSTAFERERLALRAYFKVSEETRKGDAA